MGGPLKYYVSKSVGQMLMLADKVGGWGWPNADILRWVGTVGEGRPVNLFLLMSFFDKMKL